MQWGVFVSLVWFVGFLGEGVGSWQYWSFEFGTLCLLGKHSATWALLL
jgi:hypothetical protein